MIPKLEFNQNIPVVSLLIAMKNEEKYISDCLESLFAQDYPAEKLEVLILDGLSKDKSREIVKQLIQGKIHYKLINNPQVIQSSAWNLGIEKSSGQIISIVSAHSILSKNYVSKAVDTFFRTGADLVGGPMNAIGENNIAKVISIATSSPFGIGGAKFHYTNKEEIVDTVYMGFCARELYETVGGFDEEMVRNQDDELSYRILDNGGVIVCNPEIESNYFNRASFRSLWKQYFQYGYWKVRVLQKHPKQMRIRQFIPPLFVFSLLLSIILTLSFNWGWLILILTTGSYLIANITASLNIAIKERKEYLVFLPGTFVIIHLSYGLGFLIGLIKFLNRWSDTKGLVPNFPKKGVIND